MSRWPRYAVTTHLGRVHVGGLAANNARGVLLEDDDGGTTFIARDDVASTDPVSDGTEFPFRP